MKTLCKIILASAIAMGLMCLAIVLDASDRVCLTVYFTSGLVLCTLFGVFDIDEPNRGSIRKEDADAGEAQMRDAA